ncbi:MAG: hypothetical protein HZC29_01205 [Thaumarchaeota archaeon]|nr:hypothetical protein [Nitrososphaerota archaeon]
MSADAVSGTTSQIAVNGLAYREFAADTFDARLDLVLDPYGTNTQTLIDHINDKSLGTCELQAEKSTGGKQIQFTASKINDSDQPHQQGNTPSKISLGIVGSTFNVNTL